MSHLYLKKSVWFLSFALFIGACKKDHEKLSSDKAIEAFTIQQSVNAALKADINASISKDTITFTLPSDTVGKTFMPTILVSSGATVTPASKSKMTFIQPVPYYVTAADGSVKKYVVICKSKASDKDIFNFRFLKKDNPQLAVDVSAFLSKDTIKIRLPQNYTDLTPVVTYSSGAHITGDLSKGSFATPRRYTITAADGSTKSYVTALSLVTAPQLKGLKINGVDCAYDAPGKTFYYPVSLNTALNTYTVAFNADSARYLTIGNNSVFNNYAVNFPLSTNQQLTVLASDEFNRQQSYKLVITGLPVVQLTASQTIADNAVNAGFTLIDPDYVAHGSQQEVSTGITIHIRGNTARNYPKKAYSVSLVDNQGNDADIPLLGLRNDNSWILDAMYIDQARMRNRVCTDIWNSMNNVPYLASEPAALNGTRGYMTEVFLNNQYWGVYCLTEKVDRKQLQIKKKTGHMYQADDWTPEVMFKGASAYSNASATWGGWEFEYPDLGDSPAPDWSYLSDFVKFVSTSSDSQFTSQIANKVYLSNIVDYFIFINVFAAHDNQSKNTYFSFYDSSKDSKFFYTMWDMDATLGRYWDGSYVYDNDRIIGGASNTNNNNLINRLFTLNAGNFRQMVKDRWNMLKANQLSKAAINARIELYRAQLNNTNAFARERATWNNITQDLNAETAYMEKFYSIQYDLIDLYISGL